MRKMDEMELKIRDTAIRISWFFTVVALFIWGIYLYVTTKEITLPLALVFLQMLVYSFVSLLEKWKVDDEGEQKKTLVFFGGLVVFLLIFGFLLVRFVSKAA